MEYLEKLNALISEGEKYSFSNNNYNHLGDTLSRISKEMQVCQ